MNKLLFWICLLFGLMSVTSMATYDPNSGSYNYGCGPGIPPDVCMAGSNPGSGSAVYVEPTYYGAIAVNPDTGYWASSSAHTNKKTARESALSRCGKNCKLINVDAGRCVGVAYSANDKILESDSAVAAYASIGYNTRVERSNEKALKKCEKKGGSSCKILVNVCAVEGTSSTSISEAKIWGAVAVDSSLGKIGWAWNFESSAAASTAAENDCKKMGGKNCPVYMTFGDGEYGTLAASRTTGAYGYSVKNTEVESQKEALAQCSQYANDCYIYMTVNALKGMVKTDYNKK